MDPHNRQLTYHNAYGHVIAAQGGVEACARRFAGLTPPVRQSRRVVP